MFHLVPAGVFHLVPVAVSRHSIAQKGGKGHRNLCCIVQCCPMYHCWQTNSPPPQLFTLQTPAFWGGDISLRVTAVVKAGNKTIDVPADVSNIQARVWEGGRAGALLMPRSWLMKQQQRQRACPAALHTCDKTHEPAQFLEAMGRPLPCGMRHNRSVKPHAAASPVLVKQRRVHLPYWLGAVQGADPHHREAAGGDAAVPGRCGCLPHGGALRAVLRHIVMDLRVSQPPRWMEAQLCVPSLADYSHVPFHCARRPPTLTWTCACATPQTSWHCLECRCWCSRVR